MISAILAAVLITPLGIGHIGQPPIVSAQIGRVVAVNLPPRSYLIDESVCHWFRSRADVEVYYPHARYQMIQPTRWTDDHSIAHYGPVTFNGMTFTNTSRDAWANVSATIYQAC